MRPARLQAERLGRSAPSEACPLEFLGARFHAKSIAIICEGALHSSEATMPNCVNDPARETEVVWLDDTGSGRTDLLAESVLSLENVAKTFSVSKLSLRYYELRGLIRRRHSLDGVPVYGWADCERLALIIKCRKAGVMLGDIVTIIQATDDDMSARQIKAGRDTYVALVERLGQRRRAIDEALAELGHVYAVLTAKLLGDTKDNSRD